MSSGLYGVAVFSVNLREHHHGSQLAMYVTFFSPFLMFSGMVTIPLIHYWRNVKLKAFIDSQYEVIRNKLVGVLTGNGSKRPASRLSGVSLSMWTPVRRHDSE